jgi:Uma2 family endonuclease
LEIQRLNLGWQIRPGGTGVRITEHRSQLPDLCVITSEQEQAVQNQASILETPPQVVVEIVSPESINRDYRVKRTEYTLAGVPEYWIIDPLENKVSILNLNEGFFDVTEFKCYAAIISSIFLELKLSGRQTLSQ